MPTTMLTRREVPAAIRAARDGGRSREAVLATDQPVEVYDQRSGRVVLEVLMLEGAEWSEPVPMLIDHDRRIPSQIGSVTSIRREPGKLAGTLHFARNDAGNDAWALVTDGHTRSVSVGYRILEQTEIRAGQTKAVSGRLFTAPADRPLRVVSRWSLKEVSLVAIAADTAAGIRSFPSLSRRSNSTMTVSTTIPTRNLDQMRLADLAAVTLRSRGIDPPESDIDALEQAFPARGRAGTSGAGGVGDLFGIVSQWCLDGWRQGVDTLDGIYRVATADSYLEEKLANVAVHPAMVRIGRGQVAPTASFGVDSATSRIVKFGLQFILDEQDAIDGAPLGVWRIAVEEALRAARNLVSDLLWSTLIKNPNCPDGLPLFHADRGNLTNAALDTSPLDLAMAAIGGHAGVDEVGNPVHYNLKPDRLIVCPSALQSARRLVRPSILDGGELRVLAESRLSDAGVTDPTTGEVLVGGSGSNWMLAASGQQKASIVLSLLNGKTEPTVRQFALDGGQWGLGFDLSFSCGVTALDGGPLYWSSADG